MATLLNKSRLYLFLQGLSRKARLFFTLFLLTITFGLWLFFFYFPLKQEIKIETLNYSNNLNLQKIYKDKLKVFDDIKNENYLLESKFKSEFIKTKSLSNELDSILNLINQHHLTCKQISPLKASNKDFYKKDYYCLKIKGDFKSMISFFDQLKRDFCNIKFKDFYFEKKYKKNVMCETKIRILNFVGDKWDVSVL